MSDVILIAIRAVQASLDELQKSNIRLTAEIKRIADQDKDRRIADLDRKIAELHVKIDTLSADGGVTVVTAAPVMVGDTKDIKADVPAGPRAPPAPVDIGNVAGNITEFFKTTFANKIDALADAKIIDDSDLKDAIRIRDENKTLTDVSVKAILRKHANNVYKRIKDDSTAMEALRALRHKEVTRHATSTAAVVTTEG